MPIYNLYRYNSNMKISKSNMAILFTIKTINSTAYNNILIQ